jgi:hypothetical protein
MKAIVYTTGCPRCRVLAVKLSNAGIDFDTSSDVDLIINAGFTEVPVLQIEEDIFLTFTEALDWIVTQERVVI